MARRGGYAHAFHHRLGLIEPLGDAGKPKKRIWIQAVSVGELLSIQPLLHRLVSENSVHVVLTTTTSTAFELARRRWQRKGVTVGIFPLDFWPCSACAWKRIAPDLAILTESELWPEHLYQASIRKVPVIVINGRMSDRTFGRLRRLPPIARYLLNPVTRILCSSSRDEKRYRALGLKAGRYETTGNIKFDAPLEVPLSSAKVGQLKELLGFIPEGPDEEIPLVLAGASTWPGEEETLIRTVEAVRSRGIPCRLLLVPRHSERRESIQAHLQRLGISYHMRSRDATAAQPVIIYVADTTGELKMLIQAADLVFIGKSMPPYEEGQTPIEAAGLGKPVMFGPGMSNFQEIGQTLLDCGAAAQIADEDSLSETTIRLLQDPSERNRMSKAAKKWHASNRGATEKTLQYIRTILR